MKPTIPGDATAATAPAVELASLSIRSARLQSQVELGQQVAAPPRVAVTAGFRQQEVAAGSFEAVLELRAAGSAGAEPLFTASVEQAGIVKVPGAGAGEAAGIVAGCAPALLYPYARQALEDLLGGSQFTGFRLGIACPPVTPPEPPAG